MSFIDLIRSMYRRATIKQTPLQHGGADDDEIDGEGDDDVLKGGTGADIIEGNIGDDALFESDSSTVGIFDNSIDTMSDVNGSNHFYYRLNVDVIAPNGGDVLHQL